MNKWGRWAAVAIVVVLLLGAALLSGSMRKASAEPAKRDNLRTVLEVMALVKINYVDDVSLSNLIGAYAKKGTIPGMLSVLKDPYSRFMVPTAYDEMKIDNSGEFGGIGIYLGMSKNNELTVIAPIEGTPAERLGVKPGDLIVQIDGRSTVNMSTDEAANLMRGPKGTKVVITIVRGKDKEKKEFAILREIIRVPSVKAEMLKDHIGYLRLASFSGKSAEDVENGLDKLEKQGMKALVLDLRFNPGGLLTAATEIANKFIAQGPLLHVVNRQHEKQTFYAKPGLVHPSYPIVVLINKGSASAAEILSGALKDTGRAMVVGTTSFGKGSVQTIYPLSDGSALALTTQKWLTSGGHSISMQGITPDVVIRNPGDEEMEAELSLLQAERSGQKTEAPGKPAESGEKAKQTEKPAVTDTKDYQLEKATEILEQQLAAKQRPAA